MCQEREEMLIPVVAVKIFSIRQKLKEHTEYAKWECYQTISQWMFNEQNLKLHFAHAHQTNDPIITSQ